MKVAGMCLNWKVLTGLGAVGFGLLLFAPEVFAAALPLLLLAACPLSMLLMPLLMRRSERGTEGDQCAPVYRVSDVAQPTDRLEQAERLRDELAEVKARQRDLTRQLRDFQRPEEVEAPTAGREPKKVAAPPS